MNNFQNQLIKETHYQFTGESDLELYAELVKVKKETKSCNAFIKIRQPIGFIIVNSRYFSKSWISRNNSFYGWVIRML